MRLSVKSLAFFPLLLLALSAACSTMPEGTRAPVDVAGQVYRDVLAADYEIDPLCESREILLAHTAIKPHTQVVDDAGKRAYRWSEVWTVRRCQAMYAYTVDFSRPYDGTPTSYRIQLPPETLDENPPAPRLHVYYHDYKPR